MTDQQTTDCPPDPDKDPIGAWAWLVEDAGDRRFLDAKLRAEFGRRDAEIERLRGYLNTLLGMAGGLADHAEMQALIEEALADG